MNLVHEAKVERVVGRPLDESLGEVTAALLIPEVNVAVAHIIWLDSGWRPWSCYP